AIGLGASFVALSVESSLIMLERFRHWLRDWVVDRNSGLAVQYVADVGMCLSFVTIAAWLVCYYEVLAAGSGIPEIKCYLNGVKLPKVVGFRTLIAKAVGIVFSVAAGLPCGKEGPMIHSGAIVGAMVSHLNLQKRLRALCVEVEMRDFVAAGACAGVSAAFGAPIGAVLFAVEEGASHMNPKVLTQLFVASATATFCSRLVLGPLFGGIQFGELGTLVPVSFGRYDEIVFRLREMLIFMLMGVCGGLLGALFNEMNRRLCLWRSRHIGPRGWRRFLEALGVTFVIASCRFLVPIFWRAGAGHHLQATRIDELGPMEKLWWEMGQPAIKQLFHAEVEPEHVLSHHELLLLLLYAIANYVFSCWTYGLGVPSGLFVPSLLTGAAFGRFVGELLAMLFGRGSTAPPGVYALVGAAAMLAGTARITISLAMIVIEATGIGSFGLPIFATVMIAKWTGDYFNRGIYDLHIIELKHVPILGEEPEHDMVRLKVEDVMASSLVVLEAVETVGSILTKLESCSHQGFPVMADYRLLEGTIQRGIVHLILLRGAKYHVFQPATGLLSSPPPIIPYEAMAWRRINKFPDIKDVQRSLTREDYGLRIDLRPYVNRNGYTVRPDASMASCYSLFRHLGLRHLPVVRQDGTVCGIITRKDLILSGGLPGSSSRFLQSPAAVDDDDSDREHPMSLSDSSEAHRESDIARRVSSESEETGCEGHLEQVVCRIQQDEASGHDEEEASPKSTSVRTVVVKRIISSPPRVRPGGSISGFALAL
ncbi:unnamed protein product, partial [Polarella glacialis]